MKKVCVVLALLFIPFSFATAQTTGLVAHYTFDGGTMVGKIGQAREFNGVDDFLDLGSDPSFAMNTTNALTISVWAYPLSTTDNPGDIIIRGSSANSADNTIYYLAQSLTGWVGRVSDGVNRITVTTGAGTLVTNTWQHLVLVWSGASKTLYIYIEMAHLWVVEPPRRLLHSGMEHRKVREKQQ